MIHQVTIIGMGAMGIMLGSRLAEKLGPNQVRFVATGERLVRYQREGVSCNREKQQFCLSDGRDGVADLLMIAVKGPDLEEAITEAAPCVGPDTIVLSILNGVTSEEILARAFGEEKVLYTVTQGCDAVRVGHDVTYHLPGMVFIGIPEGDPFQQREKLEEVHQFFQQMELPHAVEADVIHRMWCKFMLNVGVNQVCMAFETDYGGVQVPGELRDTMIAAMHEVRKVGACQGILVTQKDLAEYVAVMDALPPRSLPSMRQDGLAHRRTEVALFAGAVTEMAERFGIQTPVNRMLLDKIRGMEQSWENRCQG